MLLAPSRLHCPATHRPPSKSLATTPPFVYPALESHDVGRSRRPYPLGVTPLSKSVRLLELTNLLSAREVGLAEIVRRFSISERTAYRDLADLGYSSIPITRGKRGYPQYSWGHSPQYSWGHSKLVEGSTLRPLNLDARERAVLKLALSNPSLRKLAPLRKTLQSLAALEQPNLDRLGQVSAGHATLRRASIASHLQEAKLDAAARRVKETSEALRLATFDTPNKAGGTAPNKAGGTAPNKAGGTASGPNAQTALDPLESAIRAKRRVEIHYASLSGGTKEWRAVDPQYSWGHSPWRVFERASAWYLVGHCLKNREPRIFRLDRISGVRTATSTPNKAGGSPNKAGGTAATPPFTPPGAFDLDTYLRDAWRVFVGRERHDIVLRFAPRLAPLILNAEHHAGEEKKELRDGSVDYRVSLSPLEEIARWVVGFGGGVEVVGPGDLMTRARALLK